MVTSNKVTGVMNALSNRGKKIGEKRGGVLLGIAQKLADRRKTNKDGSGGCGKK